MKKRIFALLLAVLMIAGSLPITPAVYAASSETPEATLDENNVSINVPYFSGTAYFNDATGRMNNQEYLYDELVEISGIENPDVVKEGSSELVLDGVVNAEEWGTPILDLSSDNAAKQGDTVVSGENTYYWHGVDGTNYLDVSKGLHYKLWMAWDEEYLYVAADIDDPDGQLLAAGGADVWNGDCLEIRVDPDGPNASTGGTGYDAITNPWPWGTTVRNSITETYGGNVMNMGIGYMTSGDIEIYDMAPRYAPSIVDALDPETAELFKVLQWNQNATFYRRNYEDSPDYDPAQETVERNPFGNTYGTAWLKSAATAANRRAINTQIEVAIPWAYMNGSKVEVETSENEAGELQIDSTNVVLTGAVPEAGDDYGLAIALINGGRGGNGYNSWLTWGSGICAGQFERDYMTAGGSNSMVLVADELGTVGCEHNFAAATCGAPETCNSCGYERGFPTEDHTYTHELVTDPTCNEAGSATYTCSECGSTKTEAIDALGHNFDEGVVTIEPTCTVAGEKTYTCTRCGNAYIEEIPVIAHVGGGENEETIDGKQYLVVRCTVCSSIISMEQISNGLQYDTDGDGERFVYEVTSTTIQATDTQATVDIEIVENTGIWAQKFYLVYDKELTVASFADGVAFPEFDPSKDPGLIDAAHATMVAADADYSESLALAGLEGNENWLVTTVYSECDEIAEINYDTGTLCSVTFNVDPASEKDSYTVYAIPATGGWILREEPGHPNADEYGFVEIYDPVGLPGTITVERPAPVVPTIIVSDAEVTFGAEKADFTLSIENNPGIWGVLGYINYDEGMSLAAFENGEVFTDADLALGGPMVNESQRDIVVTNNRQVKAVYEAVGASWEGSLATQVYFEPTTFDMCTNNGVLVSFSLNTAGLEAGAYEIAYYFDEIGFIDDEGNTVEFEMVAGALTVLECAHEYELGGEAADPTCTMTGLTGFICTKCGKAETIDALGHNYNSVVTAPTCTADGYTTYTCTRNCGEENATYTEPVAALGHAYDEGVITTEPACTVDGVKTFTCTRNCGEEGATYTESVAALGHAYDDGVITTEPTCTVDGVKTFTCTWNCGEEGAVYTEPVAALGHDYDSVKTDATCTKEGFITKTCTRNCGEENDVVVEIVEDALGHAYDEGVITTEPVCGVAGEKTYTCTRDCGENGAVYTEPVAALEHDYNLVDAKAATCEEDGYTGDQVCSLCNDTIYGEVIPAIGHNYELVGDVEATCEEDGYTGDQICSNCGDVIEGNVIPALGHDYMGHTYAPTCVEDGYTTYICQRCGDSFTDDIVNELGHSFNGGVCAVCGINEEYAIGSEHPYANNCDETKTITVPGAEWIKITFSTKTHTEQDNDYITICDKDNTVVGTYSGNGLSGRSVYICGDTVSINLNTNGETQDYGYEIAECVVSFEKCSHIGMSGGVCPVCSYNVNDYFEYYYDGGTDAIIYRYIGSAFDVSVPAYINGYPVKMIHPDAFVNIGGVGRIHIPETVTRIVEGCFSGCIDLKEIDVDINNPVYRSEDGVLFTGDTLLKYPEGSAGEYVIPGSVRQLAYYSFYNCQSLTGLTVPESVVSIGEGAFEKCYSLEKLDVADIAAWCGIDFSSYRDNPLYYANELYSNGELVEDLVIPGSVRQIAYYSFYYCTSINSVSIPSSVVSIGNSAFENCIDLESVTLEDGVNAIGNYTFRNCTSLANVYLSDTLTSIGEGAFENCTALKSIDLPESLEVIGNSAFRNCESLEEAVIPGSVRQIAYYTFYNCKSLKSFEIPDSVVSIGNCAFMDCRDLETLYIGSGVEAIGELAFGYCEALRDVYITDLEAWCNISFNNCPNEFWGYTNPISLAENVYVNGELLVDLVVPGNKVNTAAFCGYGKLRSVTIPEGVEYIGYGAFGGCSNLRIVTISDGPKTISYSAFGACDNISHVFYEGSIAQWNDTLDIFNGNDSLLNATRHYRVEGNCLETSRVEPTCTESGSIDTACTLCGYVFETQVLSPIGHIFENGSCILCGGLEIDFIESKHPYSNNTDESRVIIEEGADRIAVTFSEETYIGSGDYVYIYDGNGQLIDQYSYSLLSGRRILVNGDTIIIRLVSDGEYTSYGYKVVKVEAYYGECTHDNMTNGYCYECGYDVSNYFNYVIVDGEAVITKCYYSYYFSSPSEIVVPERIDGCPVTVIASYAFSDNRDVTKIVLPETVREIRLGAFEGCRALSEIVLPEALEFIGEGAFEDCRHLAEITIPESVKIIEDGAFEDCRKLETVTLTNKIESIGDFAFYNCVSIETVNFIGTEEEWNALVIGEENEDLLAAEVNFISHDVFPVTDSEKLAAMKEQGLTGNGRFTVDFTDADVKECVFSYTAWATGEYYISISGQSDDEVYIVNSDGEVIGYFDTITNSKETLLVGGTIGETYYVVVRSTNTNVNKFNTYITINFFSGVKGDATGDGKVNSRDMLAIKRYQSGLTEETSVSLAAIDYNGDGRLNSMDTLAIKRLIAGK